MKVDFFKKRIRYVLSLLFSSFFVFSLSGEEKRTHYELQLNANKLILSGKLLRNDQVLVEFNNEYSPFCYKHRKQHQRPCGFQDISFIKNNSNATFSRMDDNQVLLFKYSENDDYLSFQVRMDAHHCVAEQINTKADVTLKTNLNLLVQNVIVHKLLCDSPEVKFHYHTIVCHSIECPNRKCIVDHAIIKTTELIAGDIIIEPTGILNFTGSAPLFNHLIWTGSVKNKGHILADNDLQIDTFNNPVYEQDQYAGFKVNGNLIWRMDRGTLNFITTKIFATGTLALYTKQINLLRPEKECSNKKQADGYTHFHGYFSHDPRDRSMPSVICSDSNMVITAEKINNVAGLIISKKGMAITVSERLDNNAVYQWHEVKDGKSKKHSHTENEWMPASIISGDTMMIIIRNEQCLLNSSDRKCSLLGLENTGAIIANGVLQIGSDNVTKIINGLKQNSQTFVNYKMLDARLLLDFTGNKRDEIAVNVDRLDAIRQQNNQGLRTERALVWNTDKRIPYVYTDPYTGWDGKPIDLERGFYIHRAPSPHKGAPDLFFHPQLDLRTAYSPDVEAQLIDEIIISTFGMRLKGFKDAKSQWEWLRERGFLLGLVKSINPKVKPDPFEDKLQWKWYDERPSHIRRDAACDTSIKQDDSIINMHFARYALPRPHCFPDQLYTDRLNAIHAGTHRAMGYPWNHLRFRTQYDFLPHYEKSEHPFLLYAETDCGSNERCYAPMLFLRGLEDLFKANQGLIEGKQVIINAPYSEITNYGTIRSLENVTITAKTVKNVSPETAHYQRVGSKIYEIRTQLPGGMIVGFDVDINVGNDPSDKDKTVFSNQGGTVFASHNVNLYAKYGNQEIKPFLGSHVVAWDSGALGALFGAQDSSLVVDYKKGSIVAGNDISMIANAGHILGEASELIAGNDANIKGAQGVLFRTLMSTYVDNERIDFFSASHRENVSVGQMKVSSLHNINIESAEGKTEGIGAAYEAADKLFFKGKKGNEQKVASAHLNYWNTSWGFTPAGFFYDTTKVRDEHIVQTTVSAREVIYETDFDNVFEAVIMCGKDAIHVTAGRDNKFVGHDRKTTVEQNGITLGISYPGSDLLAGLTGPGFMKYAENHEMAKVLQRLKNGNPYDIAADSTKLLIDALRTALDYKDKVMKAGMGNVQWLSSHLGFTDGVNFNPSLQFRLGATHTTQESHEKTGSAINTVNFVCRSGGKTVFADGTEVNVDYADIEGSDVTLVGAEDFTETTSIGGGVTISFGATGVHGVGADASYEQSSQKTHKQTTLKARKVKIHCKTLGIVDAFVSTEIMDGKVSDKFYVIQHPDTFKKTSMSGNVNIGADSAGFGFNAAHADQQSSQQASGIRAETGQFSTPLTEMKGRSEIRGGFVFNSTQIQGSCSTDTEHMDDNGFQFGGTPNARVAQGMAELHHEGANKQTLNTPFVDPRVQVNSDHTEGIIRDQQEAQKVVRDEHSYWRFAIPIVNPAKVKKVFSDLQDLFKKEDVSIQEFSEKFDALKKEGGVREYTDADGAQEQGSETEEQPDQSPETNKQTESTEPQKKANDKDQAHDQQPKKTSTKSGPSKTRKAPIQPGHYKHQTSGGQVVEYDFCEYAGGSIDSSQLGAFEIKGELFDPVTKTQQIFLKNNRFQVKITGDPMAIAQALLDRKVQIRGMIDNFHLQDDSLDRARQEAKRSLESVASLLLDFVPVIGNVKMASEAIRGIDLVTGEPLAGWQRALCVLGAAAPLLVKGGKLVYGAVKGVNVATDVASEIGKTTKVVETATEGTKAAEVVGEGAKVEKSGVDLLTKGKPPVRTEPKNLYEQIALKNAQYGEGNPIMAGKINDPKYPAGTWAKKQYKLTDPNGKDIVIHYWENLVNGIREGFKFKNI